MIFVSPKAVMDGSKAIRGGITHTQGEKKTIKPADEAKSKLAAVSI